jgi:hypothetical protein
VIEVARSTAEGLKVPVAATRWNPSADLVEPDPEADARKRDGPKKRPGQGSKRGRVWVRVPSGRVKAIPVKIITSDGTSVGIEPLGKEPLSEGTDVVLGIAVEEAADAGTTNPFAPSFPGGRRGGGR